MRAIDGCSHAHVAADWSAARSMGPRVRAPFRCDRGKMERRAVLVCVLLITEWIRGSWFFSVESVLVPGELEAVDRRDGPVAC